MENVLLTFLSIFAVAQVILRAWLFALVCYAGARVAGRVFGVGSVSPLFKGFVSKIFASLETRAVKPFTHAQLLDEQDT